LNCEICLIFGDGLGCKELVADALTRNLELEAAEIVVDQWLEALLGRNRRFVAAAVADCLGFRAETGQLVGSVEETRFLLVRHLTGAFFDRVDGDEILHGYSFFALMDRHTWVLHLAGR